MRDLGRGRRLHDRLRISQADVLGSQNAQPGATRDELAGRAPPSIIPRFNQYKAAFASEFRNDLIKADARLKWSSPCRS